MPDQKSVIPKQQHWVPQVYLKQFATLETMDAPDPKVWVWHKDTQEDRRAPTRVEEVCSQNFLYSPTQTDGSRDGAMEAELGKIESRAGDVWPTIIEQDSALEQVEIRQFLAHFIALMHLRNKWIHDKFRETAELVGQLYGLPDSDPSGGTVDVSDSKNFAKGLHVQSLRDSPERIASQLFAKRWVILCERERTVATSDRPVLFYDSTKGAKRSSMFDSDMFFPLSADRVLFMTSLPDAPHNVCHEAPPSLSACVNGLLKHNAMHIVMGASPFSELPCV